MGSLGCNLAIGLRVRRIRATVNIRATNGQLRVDPLW